jgi:hypothetical protein
MLTDYRIIVTTIANVGQLGLCGQMFSHVFVDDASQVSEVDALFAISLARSVVLVGHPHGSAPLTYSALKLALL